MRCYNQFITKNIHIRFKIHSNTGVMEIHWMSFSSRALRNISTCFLQSFSVVLISHEITSSPSVSCQDLMSMILIDSSALKCAAKSTGYIPSISEAFWEAILNVLMTIIVILGNKDFKMAKVSQLQACCFWFLRSRHNHLESKALKLKP